MAPFPAAPVHQPTSSPPNLPTPYSLEMGPGGPSLQVAVKSLKPQVLSDLEDLRRFLLEVRRVEPGGGARVGGGRGHRAV